MRLTINSTQILLMTGIQVYDLYNNIITLLIHVGFLQVHPFFYKSCLWVARKCCDFVKYIFDNIRYFL